MSTSTAISLLSRASSTSTDSGGFSARSSCTAMSPLSQDFPALGEDEEAESKREKMKDVDKWFEEQLQRADQELLSLRTGLASYYQRRVDKLKEAISTPSDTKRVYTQLNDKDATTVSKSTECVPSPPPAEEPELSPSQEKFRLVIRPRHFGYQGMRQPKTTRRTSVQAVAHADGSSPKKAVAVNGLLSTYLHSAQSGKPALIAVYSLKLTIPPFIDASLIKLFPAPPVRDCASPVSTTHSRQSSRDGVLTPTVSKSTDSVPVESVKRRASVSKLAFQEVAKTNTGQKLEILKEEASENSDSSTTPISSQTQSPIESPITSPHPGANPPPPQIKHSINRIPVAIHENTSIPSSTSKNPRQPPPIPPRPIRRKILGSSTTTPTKAAIFPPISDPQPPKPAPFVPRPPVKSQSVNKQSGQLIKITKHSKSFTALREAFDKGGTLFSSVRRR
ncbi:hypothetical protein DFH27DRAFT_649553 [Peziza echinospora]|nr:hypothetical protein DFH27DRAFT_649553 [Peziza echinospora]